MLQNRTGESAKIQFPAISVRYSTLLAQGQYLTGTGTVPYWHRDSTLLAQGQHLTGTGTVPYWHRDRELNCCAASRVWLRI